MSTSRVVLITGGNRGLGYETARQLLGLGYEVILSARSDDKGEAALRALLEACPGAKAATRGLDVTSLEQAQALASWIAKEYGRLDALVNNAGAIFDRDASPQEEAYVQSIRQSFENNALSAWIVSRAMAPLLCKAEGNIVNVSSGMGALHEMGSGFAGYRISKTALNAITRILHGELHPSGVRVNSVCPGWVRTEMGGPDATRAPNEGAQGIVWAATLDKEGPSGGFFRDGKAIEW